MPGEDFVTKSHFLIMKRLYFKTLIVLLCVLFFPSISYAGKDKPEYNVNRIPKSLLKNAHAVVRDHQIVFQVHSLDRAVLKEKMVVTILDKYGEDYAKLQQYYDLFSKVSDIKGTIYYGDGTKMRGLKREEIKDYSAVSSYSIYESSRAKYADPRINVFPYTIEYTYEIRYNGILEYPDFYPQPGCNLSIEYASFQVEMPFNTKIRFWENSSFNGQCNKHRSAKGEVHKWELKSVPAIQNEPWQSLITDQAPIVLLSPSKFSLDNNAGSMESWDSFGEWINLLNKDRQELPPTTSAVLQELVKGIDNPRDRIKKVYQYVQKNSRYVSIQYGIGGYQPFSATEVDNWGYGDCKALSNYTRACLQAVGVESIYTLVWAGDKAMEIPKDFPSSLFNHAILAVPCEKDTIWLECTSQVMPFGYLGSFTENRPVLLNTVEGGVFTRTPKYADKINARKSYVEVTLTDAWNADILTEDCYSGVLVDERIGLNRAHNNYQEQYLYKTIAVPTFTINKFKSEVKGDILPQVNESIEIQAEEYAVKSGSSVLVPACPVQKTVELLPNDLNRESDIFIRRGRRELDSIYIEFPKGFEVEALPDETREETKYGSYSKRVTFLVNGRLLVIREFLLKSGTYPKEEYNDLRAFLKRVHKSDKQQIVLRESLM